MKMRLTHLSSTSAWTLIGTVTAMMTFTGWWTTGLFYEEAAKVELQASAQEYAKVIRERLSTIETRLLLDVAPLATRSELTKSRQFILLSKEFEELVRLEVRDENGNLFDVASVAGPAATARTLSPGLLANFSAANDTRKVTYSAPYAARGPDNKSTTLMDVFIPTAQISKTMVVATLKPDNCSAFSWLSTEDPRLTN